MSEIPGLKVIRANTYGIDRLDDPTFPFKLVANFRPPDFMIVAFIGLYGGSEEFVIRALTRAAIEECIRQNEWIGHPRLQRLTLTLPDGTEEELNTKEDAA